MINDVMASAYCPHCNTLLRLERTQLTGRTGPFLYCPLCGMEGLNLTPDITPNEYWEVLAQEYNVPPDLMQEIFNTWDTSEYSTLREHVDSIRAEALEPAS